jgi:nucleotidyltransferase/DNA polymerase involved in DNA repair
MDATHEVSGGLETENLSQTIPRSSADVAHWVCWTGQVAIGVADTRPGSPPWETLLRVASQVAAEARQLISDEAGFRSSAGIACNKILAKLASGLHKPNDQTVLPPPVAASFVAPLPVRALSGAVHSAAFAASLPVRIWPDVVPNPSSSSIDVHAWLSASTACNKSLAKLATGLHKPDDQTMLPSPVATAFVDLWQSGHCQVLSILLPL